MSQPELPHTLSEVLEQTTWYQDASGTLRLIEDMPQDLRSAASDRLLRLALPFAQNVFRDLYAYAAPSGEQAQWEVERGEAQAEHILASVDNAREWMAQTPLYTALKGTKPYEDWEPPEMEETAPPMRQDQQMEVERAELDKVIARTRENLRYLEELRGRLA